MPTQPNCKFPSALVNQTPIYDTKPRFRKKLKPGRPSKKKGEQHWVR